MDVDNRIKRIEERIEKLEQYREKDKSQLHQLDTSLQVFINEMKNISNELKNVVSNFKEAIIRSTNAQEKELNILKEKVADDERRIKEIDEKFERETIGQNSEKFKKYTSNIINIITSSIIAFVLIKIGLG